MTATRAAATAVTLAALALGLTACGDDDADASSDNSPDLDPTSEATSGRRDPTATQPPNGPKPIPTSYPDVGLEYDGLPDVEGRYRDALEVFVAFDRGRLQLLREAKMNPLVTDNAAEPVVATFQSTAAYLQEPQRLLPRHVDRVLRRRREGGRPARARPLPRRHRAPLRRGWLGVRTRWPGPGALPRDRHATGRPWTVTEASSQEGTC